MSLAVLASVTIERPATPVAAAAPLALETFHAPSGPLGPITVIGDSVLQGSMLSGPTLSDQLAARGWGPIRVRAGLGYNTGSFGGALQATATHWITSWRAGGWDPPDIVVNLGANDSGTCRTNAACARSAILRVVATIGPGHRIWWPKITAVPAYIANQHTWNAALDQIASERADFHTWDWPAAMATGIPSPDFIHLTADGYRLRSALMANEITADLARGRRVGGDAALPKAIGSASDYVTIGPRRVRDTRADGTGPVRAGRTLRLDLSPHIPPGTTAVAVNLTSDGSRAPGFLSAHPCNRPRREVSNVNYVAGQPRGALAVVPVTPAGEVCVFTKATSHIIADLQGAFVPPGNGGIRFTPSSPPKRLVDTRQTGRSTILELAVPTGAAAVAVNLTATGASGPGWLRAFPCGSKPPAVSNVNYLPGESIAGAAMVPVSPAGTICVQSLRSADVIVDITGVFSAGGRLGFVPADPARVLDTRVGIGGWFPIHGARQRLDVRVAPSVAQAVTGSLTSVAPLRPGWLRAFACAAEPPTSSVNAAAAAIMANSVTVEVGTGGRLCITSSSAGNTLLDVTGWWVP
jgi:hypothetical protein